MGIYNKALSFFVGLVLLTSCQASFDKGQSTQLTVEPSHVVVLIVDGMGPAHLNLLSLIASQHPDNAYAGVRQWLDEAVVGWIDPTPADGLVIDSAAAASQLATGHLSRSEALGLDLDGNKVMTWIERAKLAGWATGLISDTRIAHATPAAFYAHQTHRSLEVAIAEDLLASEIDLILSGGLSYFLPENVNTDVALRAHLSQQLPPNLSVQSKRNDDKNILQSFYQNGYSLAFSREQLNTSKGHKILGLFAHSGMANAFEEGKHRQPFLSDMTTVALERLYQSGKPFALMIEAGQLDWASHDNDVVWMIAELNRLGNVLNELWQWHQAHPDALIIVTSDHETGGFGFSYSGIDFDKVVPPKPGGAFSDQPYRPNFNFGSLQNIAEKTRVQTEPLASVLHRFFTRPVVEQTVEVLQQWIVDHTGFQITTTQATRLLQPIKNPTFVDGHIYFGREMVADLGDMTPYYVYEVSDRAALLGRFIANQLHVTWSTGTHTSTPVPILAVGPPQAIRTFGRWQHQVELGRRLHQTIINISRQKSR